jgi:hypothetical protein
VITDAPTVRSTRSSGRCRRSLHLIIALLVLAGVAAAGDKKSQDKPFALIAGTVWGADNRPAARVKVRIRRAEEQKFLWERVSDSRGEFAVRVPAAPADYVVVADLGGKRSAETKVHIEFDERTEIGLHLTE